MHKIKPHWAGLLVLAAFFVQASLNFFLGAGAVRPGIMIIAVTFLALFTDERSGAAAGAASGMLLDIFSVRLFGMNIILFALVGYLVGRYNTKFYKNSVITHVIVPFAASLFILFPNFLLLGFHSPSASSHLGSGEIFIRMILPSALLNSCLSIFIYAFLGRIFGLCEREL